MKETVKIKGAWDSNENAWVSETLCLTGNSYLEATLPENGRMLIRKAEHKDGPYPTALVSKWERDFEITIYGTTKGRYVKIYLTTTPKHIQITNV